MSTHVSEITVFLCGTGPGHLGINSSEKTEVQVAVTTELREFVGFLYCMYNLQPQDTVTSKFAMFLF